MPETERLYYGNPYLRRFTAHVVDSRPQGEHTAVALDATAFYPTGGGQPNDTGDLADHAVLDVFSENGIIWHVLESDLPDGGAGGQLAGVIDWDRRFDHMQQHTGQHVLSQAFVQMCDAETVAFHMGAAYSTIDLNRTDLTPEDIARAEDMANAVIDDALSVTADFVSEAELADLPLRKPPKVTEQIRVVNVEGFDWSACGGTHVENTAQIGLIKITGLERRGGELRVTFLCGRRARRDYARVNDLLTGLAVRLSVGQDDVPVAVERLTAEQHALREDLAGLEAVWIAATADTLWADAQDAGAWRLVTRALDAPADRVKRVALTLRERPGAVVFLGARGERPQLMFTRADDVALDMGALLRAAVATVGGKGGGRPDWAQGGAPDDAALEAALAAAAEAVAARSV